MAEHILFTEETSVSFAEKKNILLTGVPKSGKTTLLKRVIEHVSGIKHGFWTEEVIVAGIRNGFKIVASNDQRGLLATTHLPSAIQVGRYFVQLHNVEEISKSLLPLPESGLLFIDEIGQMELHSKVFIELVSQMIESPLPFLGIISAEYDHAFIKEVKARNDIAIIEVTAENRDTLVVELIKKLDPTWLKD